MQKVSPVNLFLFTVTYCTVKSFDVWLHWEISNNYVMVFKTVIVAMY